MAIFPIMARMTTVVVYTEETMEDDRETALYTAEKKSISWVRVLGGEVMK